MLLIKIVKTAQWLQIKGNEGDWKEFLAAKDNTVGVVIADPAKRSWETLFSFVQTFTKEEDIRMIKQIRYWDKRNEKIRHFESQGLWGQSPEQYLVGLTRQHCQFKDLYSLPSYCEGWVMTALDKPRNSLSSERMICLDCEMVLCQQNRPELVRVGVVDHNCKTLLDMLVKPLELVVDYFTSITGVSAADLEGVTCYHADAQREVMKLLTPGTILVGHNLYRDLRALKIDHARVIDIALIFKYHNKPIAYNAGLKELCKAVLGYELKGEGNPHKCLDDAIIAMRIVLHRLRCISNYSPELDEEQLSKLYLHRIPALVSRNYLQNIFPTQYSCEIQAIFWNKRKIGSTYALFKSSFDANKAFDDLNGRLGKDSQGRPQKKVAISPVLFLGKRQKLFIKVRKMSCVYDSGNGFLELDATAKVCGKRS